VSAPSRFEDGHAPLLCDDEEAWLAAAIEANRRMVAAFQRYFENRKYR
jgi:hypothetical protein